MIDGPERPRSNPAEQGFSSLEKLKLPDTIVVSSGSAIKIETVRKTLMGLFPGRTFTVLGVKAASGINEQPVGEETERGAHNRLAHAQELFNTEHAGTQAAYMSIENGIFEVAPGEWEDRAVVVISLPDGRTFSATSVGVPFPSDAVETTRALEGGFEKHTVGSVIAEQFAARGVSINKQDPQTALTNGAMTREMQMSRAIEDALLAAANAPEA